MPSPERKNIDKNSGSNGSVYVFIFIYLLPLSQEISHWFLSVDVCVRVAKYDVDYGVILDFPYALYEDVILCIQSSPPLTYIRI